MTLTPIQRFSDAEGGSTPVTLLTPQGLQDWKASAPAPHVAWSEVSGFTGKLGSFCILPAEDGSLAGVLFGLGSEDARRRSRFDIGRLPRNLPAGTYHLTGELGVVSGEEHGLAWLLGGYSFRKYRSGDDRDVARLIPPPGVDARRLEDIAAGEFLTRDLINTPANDMGPAALETAARALAERHDAEANVIAGDDLLDANFPLIHMVGRAAAQAPRLIEIRWGGDGPALTLVGKGVCFDTGGLNLKPGASMGLMKKDMGGAATVLGLAHMIMALGLKVRLRVLIPAVENSVSAQAFRPGDIVTARNGKTVEINNTDAEGRLVLADALTLGGEDAPDMMISMATLTGAARVAVGPDLAPFFTNDDPLAEALSTSAARVRDPLWRLPLWAPYEAMIEPGIADLDNAPKGGFAGATTAALFLARFATGAPRYAHFDVYGWQPADAPARPKGGVGQGARALLDALPSVLN